MSEERPVKPKPHAAIDEWLVRSGEVLDEFEGSTLGDTKVP